MNASYRIVWSKARNAFVVAHEHASAHGRSSGGRSARRRATAAAAAAAAASLLMAAPTPGRAAPTLGWAPTVPLAATALPTGGNVVSGTAVITQPAANLLTINQASQQAIINWNNFDIGAQAKVNFLQPNASASTLNRVLSSDPSQIYGQLSSNGRLYIVNPNGVIFGQGARVDVGALVASTMSLADADYLAGNNRFTRSGATGAIVNEGSLNAAPKGYVALLGASVRNSGSITAPQGSVVLAAAEEVKLPVTASGLLTLSVSPSLVDSLVENTGSGVISAADGSVFLSASAAAGLGSRVVNDGSIQVNSATGQGGSVALSADQISLAGSISANGASDGGLVQLGVVEGADTLQPASAIDITSTGSISANATQSGSGGSIVVKAFSAEGRTRFSGSLSATGVERGGSIETSGHTLVVDSGRVDTRAKSGKDGVWLLDPYDITVGGADSSGTTDGGSTGQYDAVSSGSNISSSALTAALGRADVVITTGAGGGETGNIIFTSAADSRDYLSYAIDTTANPTPHSLTLRASSNPNSAVVFQTGANVALNGDMIIEAPNLWIAGTLAANSFTATVAGNTTIDGNVNYDANRSYGWANGSITTPSGDIKITSSNLTLSGFFKSGADGVASGKVILDVSGKTTITDSGVIDLNSIGDIVIGRADTNTETDKVKYGASADIGGAIIARNLTTYINGWTNFTPPGVNGGSASFGRIVSGMEPAIFLSKDLTVNGGNASFAGYLQVDNNITSNVTGQTTFTVTSTVNAWGTVTLNGKNASVGGFNSDLQTSSYLGASGGVVFNTSQQATVFGKIGGFDDGYGTMYGGGVTLNSGKLVLTSLGRIDSSVPISINNGTFGVATDSSGSRTLENPIYLKGGSIALLGPDNLGAGGFISGTTNTDGNGSVPSVVHTFTGTDATYYLDMPSWQGPQKVDYLVVGGGGAGGTDPLTNRTIQTLGGGGGGGGGGVVTGSTTLDSTTRIPVTVGAGGSAVATRNTNNVPESFRGGSGGSSTFNGSIVAGGGGGGGSAGMGSAGADAGGSGGGGAGGLITDATSGTPGATYNGGAGGSGAQGNAGGVGLYIANTGSGFGVSAGGGGGGAGGPGSPGVAYTKAVYGGAGGPGVVNDIGGTGTTYAQGGAGATGYSDSLDSYNGQPGSVSTGSGGGGSSVKYVRGYNRAGDGASGVVVARYAYATDVSVPSTLTLTGGITLENGNNNTPSSLDSGFHSGNAIQVPSVISGTGNLAIAGNGTVTLSAANTYEGYTNVQMGTLKAGSQPVGGSNFGLSPRFILDSAGVLDLAGIDVATASIAGAGAVVNSSGTLATLTIGTNVPNSDSSFEGQIGTGMQMKLSLTKVGASKLTLTGDSFISGTTTVYGGTLQIGDLDLETGMGGNMGTLSTGSLKNDANLVVKRINGDLRPLKLSEVISGADIEGTGNFAVHTTGDLEVDSTIHLTGASSKVSLNTGVGLSAGDVNSGGDLNLSGSISVPSTGSVSIFTASTQTQSFEDPKYNHITGADAGPRYKVFNTGVAVDSPSGSRTYAYRQTEAVLVTSGYTATKTYDGTYSAKDQLSVRSEGTIAVSGEDDGLIEIRRLGIDSARFGNPHASLSPSTLTVNFNGKASYTDSAGVTWNLSGLDVSLDGINPGTVTPRPLTLEGNIKAAAKTYDGLREATGSSVEARLVGLVGNDVQPVDTTGYTLLFDNPHAGVGTRTISATGTPTFGTFVGRGMGGGDGSSPEHTLPGNSTDYLLPEAKLVPNLTGQTIDRRVLTVTAPTIVARDKTYDGLRDTDSVLQGGSIDPTSFAGQDGGALDTSRITLLFNSAHVKEATVVQAAGGLQVKDFVGRANGNGSGIGANNQVEGTAADYAIATSIASASASITPRVVAVAPEDVPTIVAAPKTYDGLVAASGSKLQGTGKVSGFVAGSGDSGSLDATDVKLVFDSAHVKVFDNSGNQVDNQIRATGAFTLAFNAGTGRDNATGIGQGNELAGKSGDYVLIAPTIAPVAGRIDPSRVEASVTIVGAAKTYDGLREALGSAPQAQTTGLAGADSLAVDTSPVTLLFDNPHAGNNRTISANGTRAIVGAFEGKAQGRGDGSAKGHEVAGLATDYVLPQPGTEVAAPDLSGQTINKRVLTVTAPIIHATGKPYDGLRDATGSTLDGGSIDPASFVGQDSGELDTSRITPLFNSAHVADAKVVEASGALQMKNFVGKANGNGLGIGANNQVAGTADDYAITTSIASASASIAPIPVTVAPGDIPTIVAAPKTYDGLVVATGSKLQGAGQISGFLPGDSGSLDTTDVKLVFDSAHVKVFDNANNQVDNQIRATGTFNIALVPAAGRENATGIAKGNEQAGQKGDYVLTAPTIAPVTGRIDPATVDVAMVITGTSKTYDGLRDATGYTPQARTTGLAGADTLAVDTSPVTLLFDNPHAGDGRTISANGTKAIVGAFQGMAQGDGKGGAKGNEVAGVATDYVLPQAGTALAVPDLGGQTILKRELAVTAPVIVPESKDFDGLRDASTSYLEGGSIDGGLVGADTATLDTDNVKLLFDSSHAYQAEWILASGKLGLKGFAGNPTPTGNATGIGPGNEVAGKDTDYFVSATIAPRLGGAIQPKVLTIDGTPEIVAVDKTYDGLVAATGSYLKNATLTGFNLKTGDVGTLGTNLEFDSAHVKAVDAGGNVVANYVRANTGTWLIFTAGTNQGDGSGIGPGNEQAGEYRDYMVPKLQTLNLHPVMASITPRPLTLNATIVGAAKTFNGLRDAPGSRVQAEFGNTVGGDVVTADTDGYRLQFDSPHAGVGNRTISATGAATIGTFIGVGAGDKNGSEAGQEVRGQLSDYAVPAIQPPLELAGQTINPIVLTLTDTAIVAKSKTYDGRFQAIGSTFTGRTVGALEGDSVALDTSDVKLNFNSAHVVGADTISASGTFKAGEVTSTNHGDGVNGRVAGLSTDYTVSADPSTTAGVPGTITARSLTVTAPEISGTSKLYDGLLSATGSTLTAGAVDGFAGADSGSLNIRGVKLAYSDAHVATTGKTINASGTVSLDFKSQAQGDGVSGAVAGELTDYVFATPSIASVAGTITPAPLTVVAPTIGGTTSKTYDGTLTAGGARVSGGSVRGFVGGDAGSLNTGGVTLAYSDAHVATQDKTIGASGMLTLDFNGTAKGTGSGASAGNEVAGQTSDYSFSAPSIASVAGTITARQLTVTAPEIRGTSKSYDGLLAASGSTLTTGAVSGFAGADGGSLGTGGVTLAYSDAHVATKDNTIAATGSVTLAFAGTAKGTGNGAGAGNEVAGQASDYSFAAPSIASVSGTITPAPLSVVAPKVVGVTSKTYDGLLTANGAALDGGWVGGFAGADGGSLNTAGVTLAYSDAHVATPSKTIGATGTVTLDFAGQARGNGSGIGTGNQVAGQPGDYAFTAPGIAPVAAQITPRTIVASAAISGQNKVYDGYTAATGSRVIGTASGVNGDVFELDASGVALNFNSAHVKEATQIGASGSVALGTNSGTANGNGSAGHAAKGAVTDYVLQAQPTIQAVSAAITPAKITSAEASISGQDKVYDGYTAATGSKLSGTASGVNGDVFDLDTSGVALNFNSAHVNEATQIIASGPLAVSSVNRGTANGNGSAGHAVKGAVTDYVLQAQPTVAPVRAAITPKALTAVAAVNAVDKVYDGLLAATGSIITGNTTGAINGDRIALDTSGYQLQFDDAHARASHTVTASGSAALGAVAGGGAGAKNGASVGNEVAGQAGDYVLQAQPTVASVQAAITPKTLTATAAINVADKVYDGLLAATGSTITGSTTGTLNGDRVALDTTGYQLQFDGAHAGNHTVTASGSATLGAISGGGAGAKNGASVGNEVAGRAGDYVLQAQPSVASVQAAITPKALTGTASITGADKVYDGLLAATGSTITGSTSGVLNGDRVALDTTGYQLQFDDAHAGTNRTVTASGGAALGAVTGAGAGARNGASVGNEVAGRAGDYVLQAQPSVASGHAAITPKALTVSAAITALDKDYDGTTQAVGSTISATAAGALNGDVIAVDTSQISLNFNSASPGVANAVSASGSVALAAPQGGGIGRKDGTAGNAVAGQAGDYALPTQPSIAPAAARIVAPVVPSTAVLANWAGVAAQASASLASAPLVATSPAQSLTRVRTSAGDTSVVTTPGADGVTSVAQTPDGVTTVVTTNVPASSFTASVIGANGQVLMERRGVLNADGTVTVTTTNVVSGSSSSTTLAPTLLGEGFKLAASAAVSGMNRVALTSISSDLAGFTILAVRGAEGGDAPAGVTVDVSGKALAIESLGQRVAVSVIALSPDGQPVRASLIIEP